MIVNKKVKGVIQMKFSICTIYLVCGNTYVSTWTVLGVFLIFFFFLKCAAPKWTLSGEMVMFVVRLRSPEMDKEGVAIPAAQEALLMYIDSHHPNNLGRIRVPLRSLIVFTYILLFNSSLHVSSIFQF